MTEMPPGSREISGSDCGCYAMQADKEVHLYMDGNMTTLTIVLTKSDCGALERLALERGTTVSELAGGWLREHIGGAGDGDGPEHEEKWEYDIRN